MAKSNAFFSLRRGSTKSQTFQVLRGQQITKDRVTDVANPKTTAQMRQRALFATAVKFYKHANQNFFKFAFEDKKQRESEYNAFMRHNLSRSTIYAYETSRNEMFPAIGNGWLLTSGSLPSPEVYFENDVFNITCGTLTASASTWGAVSTALIAQLGIQAGDLITMVEVVSSVAAIDDEPSRAPKWVINQYVIDPSSTAAIPSVFVPKSGYLQFVGVGDIDTACGFACVISRNVRTSGVKVSTSELVNNITAQDIYDDSLQDIYNQQALNSWGTTGQAILQGSLVNQ